MAEGKSLSQRKDFYSMRRKAVIDIQKWLNEGKSENAILLKLSLEYGFGKTFYHHIKDLYLELLEENKKDES
tara:strand:- start:233 stop:448 length:216 start_codon:yes stop_codon:yes gene_type:complete